MRTDAVTAWIGLTLIRLYRLARRAVPLPAACRFEPTCSEYAAQVIRSHGARIGLALAARRLLRCHPGHPGGLDQAP